MKHTRTACLLALPIFALLLVGGSNAAPGEGPAASFVARVGALATRLISAPTARAAGVAAPVRATAERVTVQATEEQKTPYLSLGVEGASVPTVYVTGTGLAELAGG
ncbi:MAG: hypothetical protein ABW208_02855, partial [Pyrinomonadaceae bacterium]